MAFKLFAFAAVFVIVQAGVVPYKSYQHEGNMDAIAETQDHVVRNFAGTVASHSKAIHTPYAAVHKQDTRITHNNNNNNKYTSIGAENAYASYESPYNHHAHAHEQHTTEAPIYHKEESTYHHETPALHHETPAYYHAAPAYQHSAPTYHHEHSTAATPVYHHGPAAHTYNHNDHAVSEYGTSQKVHYSPANMVSHMSFDGFGTHWGF